MIETSSKKLNQNNKLYKGVLLIILVASLVIPSIGTVQKFSGLGEIGVYIYVIAAFLATVLGYKLLLTKFLSVVSEKQALWLILLTFLSLVVAFVIVYPVAKSGVYGGGSDRDAALNIAATELLHLRYPYYLNTYLGNPLSPLPGAVVLAIPFVLIGNSAYQNFVWLFALFLTIKSYLKDRRLSLLLFWLILGLSPEILREFLTGGDGLSTSIYILVFILLVVKCVPKTNLKPWKKVGAAILLGLGISSRFNSVLLLPLVFSMLVQKTNWKVATKYMLLTCTVSGAITLPFYLYDTQGFSPLIQATKLTQFRPMLPYAELIIPLLGVAIACWLAFQKMDKRGIVLLRSCTIVQVFTTLSPVILSTIQDGHLSLRMLGYSIYFLFFGTLYAGINIIEKNTKFYPKLNY